MTKPVYWSTQESEFNTNYISKVEVVLPKLYPMKKLAWNFHMDDSQVKHKQNMILVHDILFKLNI